MMASWAMGEGKGVGAAQRAGVGRRQRASRLYHGWLRRATWERRAKEALALLNGTQFSAAYAVWCILESLRLLDQANFNAALGYDAFNCRLAPLDAHIHQVRAHRGQVETAAAVLDILKGSEIAISAKTSVQDPTLSAVCPRYMEPVRTPSNISSERWLLRSTP